VARGERSGGLHSSRQVFSTNKLIHQLWERVHQEEASKGPLSVKNFQVKVLTSMICGQGTGQEKLHHLSLRWEKNRKEGKGGLKKGTLGEVGFLPGCYESLSKRVKNDIYWFAPRKGQHP